MPSSRAIIARGASRSPSVRRGQLANPSRYKNSAPAVVRDLFECLLAHAHSLGLTPVCRTSLHRAAFKVGTFLNGKRLMLDIADDMRPRLQNDFSALNRALHTPVDNHSLGCDSSGDMSLARDNERSAV